MSKSKRITVALSVDASFVRLLNANVRLDGGFHPDKEVDVRGVLARVFLAEALGGFEEQVSLIAPPEWRQSIQAVSKLRSVEEGDGQ